MTTTTLMLPSSSLLSSSVHFIVLLVSVHLKKIYFHECPCFFEIVGGGLLKKRTRPLAIKLHHGTLFSLSYAIYNISCVLNHDILPPFSHFVLCVGTIVLSALANRFRLHKLGKVDQFVMSYGGLRGAVAFALVLLIKDDAVDHDKELREMFVTTTIAVIYYTVFLQVSKTMHILYLL